MTEPGVYFGMPEEEYHAIPAFSNSGIKQMRISTLNFWAWSWMNPDREDYDSDQMRWGRLMHKRVCEGREAFQNAVAVSLDPKAYPDALRTSDDIRAVLRELGEKVSGKKEDLVARLKEAQPDAVIWDDLLAEWAEENAGRDAISVDAYVAVEKAAAMVENDPQLSKAFQGGEPEVTVIWEADGVPMKARLDYVKKHAIVDFKTFTNSVGRSVDRAISNAMASFGYHVQVAVYLEAWEAAEEFIKRDSIIGSDMHGLLGDKTFLFVFQQQGPAPVTRGKVFTKGTGLDVGRMVVEDARHKFRRCTETYGTLPWVDQADITEFDDVADFPAWMWE